MPSIIDSQLPESVGKPNGLFTTTYWPLIRRAGLPPAEREEALGHLVRQYAPALRHYIMTRFRLDVDAASDLVQGFLLEKVLLRDIIARANEGDGRFRTFLATAIRHWVVDCLRRNGARKGRPAGGFVCLEELPEDSDDFRVEPDQEFDNAFVRQVLAGAVLSSRTHC